MKYKSTPQMQKMIETLATRAGVDIYETEAYLKITVGQSFMPLVIENIGNNEIAVGHFYVQNGDVVYDPEVIFFVGWKNSLANLGGSWIPVSIQHAPPFGYHRYVEHNGHEITGLNARGQRELGTFVNQWIKNLRAQGFPAGEVSTSA